MITTMKDFKAAVETVQQLMEEQRKIALTIRPKDEKWQEALNNQESKLTSNEFRVLVMGVFSSGKSSFLNAILGQKVLPTKMLPTTSVITELRYGEEKKVIVYPKPDCWDGGAAPFEVLPEDLGKYCTIDNKRGLNKREKNEAGRASLESPFRKIEVFWPVSVLKDGVVLIDSPGLDDPDCRDDIVHDYIPSASAIIYLMSAKGQAGIDVRELTMLNNIGFSQFIICVTHFDEAIQTFSSDEEREEYMEVLRAQNGAYTQLGEDGIFFLSSLDGLKAKLTSDSKLLQESGYKDMEAYLEAYLVESRAVVQLDSVIGEMRTLNREMSSAANAVVADADKDTETLKLKIEIAEAKLDEVRERKKRILEDFGKELSSVPEYVRKETEKFLDTMPDSLSMEGFEPMTIIPTGAARLNPIKTRTAAKSMAEEAAAFLRQECEAKFSTWYRNELMPGVYGIIQNAAGRLNQSFESYKQELVDIEETLKGVSVKNKDGDSIFGGAVWGLLVSLATQSWAYGLIGTIYGAGTMGRVIAAQAATGFVVGLAAAVFPITWGFLIVSALVASVLAMMTGGQAQIRAIKKDAIKSVRKAYKSKETRQQASDSILAQTMKIVNDFTAALEQAFSDDISVVESEIEDKKHTAIMGASERAEKKETMKAVMADMESLEVKIADVVSRYIRM